MTRTPLLTGAIGVLAVLVGCDTLDSPATAPSLGRNVASIGPNSAGQALYALTTSGSLVRFSSAEACTIEATTRITGVGAGETILGIDFRPATGQLYALGSASRLYTINPTTGAATVVGAAPFSPALSGTAFGFDFNPTVDRIRVVSNAGQNLRLHPETGATAAVDGTLAYGTLDANARTAPNVVGAAYTNPDNDPATGTVLFDLDAELGVLATQNPPNSGTLNTVGALGVRSNDLVGFDIAPSGIAYAVLKATGPAKPKQTCGNSELYTVSLSTGAATRIGRIGTPMPIRGLAVPAP